MYILECNGYHVLKLFVYCKPVHLLFVPVCFVFQYQFDLFLVIIELVYILVSVLVSVHISFAYPLT